jgi:hypothetical protein
MTDAESQPETASAPEVTPVEPPAEPTPAAEPVATPQPAPTRSRGRGDTGIRLFAIVGLFGCLVLAIGILIGRGWVSDQVGGVFASVDEAVAKGHTVVAVTTGRLEERVADLDTILTDISTVAETATVPAALAERAQTMADRFGQIRDGWVAIRARIDAALQTLAQVDRALPFIDLPAGPTEELAALDQRIAEIDTNIAGLRQGVAARVANVKAAATALRGAVERVTDVGNRIEAGLTTVEDRIDRAQGTIDTVMWLTTAVLLLLVGYVALLNVLLLRLTRR